MKPNIHFLILFTLTSCAKQNERTPDTLYAPNMDPGKFTNSLILSNKFFLFDTGKTYIYEGQVQDGVERVESTRISSPKTILGINCVTIEVKEYFNNKLVEFTHDWYGQDNDGNVWYFGEKVDNFDLKGNLTDHHGSWEAGMDGAKAGIIMPADPKPGMKYRQEYYFNEAEDEAEVLSINESVSTAFLKAPTICLKTKEFTQLEPDLMEHKFYAPGIGLVKIINVTDQEEMVLIKIQ